MAFFVRILLFLFNLFNLLSKLKQDIFVLLQQLNWYFKFCNSYTDPIYNSEYGFGRGIPSKDATLAI